MKLQSITEARFEDIDEQRVEKLIDYIMGLIKRSVKMHRQYYYPSHNTPEEYNTRRGEKTLSKRIYNEMYGQPEEYKPKKPNNPKEFFSMMYGMWQEAGFGTETRTGKLPITLKTEHQDNITIYGMQEWHKYAIRGIAGTAAIRKVPPHEAFIILKIYPDTYMDAFVLKSQNHDSKIIEKRIRLIIKAVIYHELRHITQISKVSKADQGYPDRSKWDVQQRISQAARTDKSHPAEIDAQATALARLYEALPPEEKKRIRTFQDLMRLFSNELQSTTHKYPELLMRKIAKLTNLGP